MSEECAEMAATAAGLMLLPAVFAKPIRKAGNHLSGELPAD
jgi:hypothetical protein